MKSKSTQERRNEIAQKLLADGNINSADLAEAYGVSTETIRKDLIYLEKTGIAKKGYGGAVVAAELVEMNFAKKAVENQQQKNQIARKAASLVPESCTILLDSGSTVFALAQQLTLKKNITVFTNSLKGGQLLIDAGIKTYLLGGEIRFSSNALVGGWGLQALKELRVDMAFMGSSGFKGRSGPCIENFPEYEMKKAMIQSAGKRIILADSSKAHKSAMLEFGAWDEFDCLVSDEGLSGETRREIGQFTEILIG